MRNVVGLVNSCRKKVRISVPKKFNDWFSPKLMVLQRNGLRNTASASGATGHVFFPSSINMFLYSLGYKVVGKMGPLELV